MNSKNLNIESSSLLLPVEFLSYLNTPPAVLQFLNKDNQYVRSEIVQDVVYDDQTGRYQVAEGSPYKFLIVATKNKTIGLIVSVILSQMRHELQFGDVLTCPEIGPYFEQMVLETLSTNDSHQIVNDLSRYSNALVKRSIHACGLGVALALFLGYEEQVVKAIGLGCLLHEYGYIINPVRHTNAGAMNLEMSFFTDLNKYTSIALNIHRISPHAAPTQKSPC